MNVLLPVDGSSASDAAVDALIHQFDPATSDVRVLHIVENAFTVNESLAFADSAAAAHIVSDVLDERRRQGRQLADRVVERLRAANFHATANVYNGEPRREVLEVANHWPADVVVMGSHGRSGLDRLLVGSVAEHVLRRASCSVEVVRPPLSAIRKAS